MSRSTVQKIAIWTGISAASLAVFAMYTRPDFLVTLANQVWTCF